MRKKFKKIVIYGGAFSPPHIGHTVAIDAVVRLFPCDGIWLMPSADRRDKTISAAGPHRVNMLKIILKEYFLKSSIKISDLEIRRPKLTTTYDTKMELEKLYPDCKFYFLIGSELLWDIEKKWIKGKELYRSTNFLAIQKPNAKIPKNLPPNIKILDEDVVWLDVSSTFVRSILKTGHSGIPYIHAKIASYIKTNGLYK